MSPLFGFLFLSFFLKKFYKDEMCILPLFFSSWVFWKSDFCPRHFSDTVLLMVITYLPSDICMASIYLAAFHSIVHTQILEILSSLYFWGWLF